MRISIVFYGNVIFILIVLCPPSIFPLDLGIFILLSKSHSCSLICSAQICVFSTEDGDCRWIYLIVFHVSEFGRAPFFSLLGLSSYHHDFPSWSIFLVSSKATDQGVHLRWVQPSWSGLAPHQRFAHDFLSHRFNFVFGRCSALMKLFPSRFSLDCLHHLKPCGTQILVVFCSILLPVQFVS
jgi:hypothetical protein